MARTWEHGSGARILRIDSAWSKEVERALETVPFDGLEVGSGLESYERLASFAEKIRWLHCPSVKSPAGLEKLENLERITYPGTAHKRAFDYRRLPKLKSLTCDFDLKPEYLNHPSLERLDVEGLKVKDLKFLSGAKRLRALRLSDSPLQSLDGLESLPELHELRVILGHKLGDVSALRRAEQLEALELDEARKLTDISAVHGLTNLRWLFVDAAKAKQRDLAWLARMPRLECAGLWLETKNVDWGVLARHPRLYDIVFYTTPGIKDEELRVRTQLAAGGRQLKTLTRFPRAALPGFRVEFVARDVVDPKPHWAYQNNLRY